ncbi:MAG: conserved membrane protein of unknown function [Candidatus Thorarchaeota archaeon]|nr:MAG: conserved membrane protein of unknown function [Candidatus Thorarchaeota archaeon]
MSVLERLRSIPQFNLIGFISPFIGLIGIFISILLLPGWTWNDAISDLGSWFRTDMGDLQILSAIIFNTGLILTGGLLFYFTISFIKRTTDIWTKLGMIIFAGTSLFLLLVGVFSEDFMLQHFFAAFSFFLSYPFAMWVIGIAWLRFPKVRWFAVFSLFLPFFCLWAILTPWAGFAIRELVSALGAILWIWIVNVLHYSGKLDVVMKDE